MRRGGLNCAQSLKVGEDSGGGGQIRAGARRLCRHRPACRQIARPHPQRASRGGGRHASQFAPTGLSVLGGPIFTSIDDISGSQFVPVSGESYSRETATQRLSSLLFSRSNWLSSVGELPERTEHLVWNRRGSRQVRQSTGSPPRHKSIDAPVAENLVHHPRGAKTDIFDTHAP